MADRSESGPDTDRRPINEQRRRRIEKIAELQALGIAPYPDRFPRTHTLAEAAALPEDARGLALAGRLILRRRFGKLTFGHIQDHDKAFQIALERDKVATGSLAGKEAYAVFQQLVDLGDFIGCEGDLMRTKTGELTLAVQRFTLLAKSLRPLPEKWHGLRDLELCYRQRYLDLIMNAETRARFALRRRVIAAFREGLDREGFVEVTTPTLVPTASGALATPFVTRHEALDMPAYLRIAPETYLKRLIVAGYDKVYEFAQSFRNEGMDPSHLQEFMLLEYYCAFWNYEDNMRFTERLLPAVITAATGSPVVKFQGREIDFTPPWPRIAFRDALARYAGAAPEDFPTLAALRAEVKKRVPEAAGIEHMGRGNLLDQLYKKCVRPQLAGPLFLVGHPIELSPLARRSDADASLTDRFQVLAGGREIVNAYSELVAPLEQRERFEEQMALRRAGDAEAMAAEDDYLLCMEYGMPPTSGWGLGLERFLCLLADRENLRDVVFFPFMRPQSEAGGAAEAAPGDTGAAPAPQGV
ncbi:MAG TPA: lysine--tRNA ligase [Planctomycetota bacterium]|jgi:lysyl-tRNA synthetase class 2|nr:lysine--tRNA ligase [Planctomycetota bacterium]OQC18956.1 MAG: Lysine--tRNA ligase [Planctomycetes bacterium ADurb.Bin069]HNS00704.1 lysine--tRNA ligase [Planctomycetota bacterium]HNU27492.1 lysine--tRNA ligase [Planctomycetota bacterium]HOE31520.1 lysine--tRNA ligase [Planctomycetota bacterium]